MNYECWEIGGVAVNKSTLPHRNVEITDPFGAIGSRCARRNPRSNFLRLSPSMAPLEKPLMAGVSACFIE